MHLEKRFRKILPLIGFFLALWCNNSPALPDDAKQPISIESDHAERNEKQGVTIYQGAVLIRQGSIRIEADTVSIYNRGERVVRIVCQGNLARYEQQTQDSNKPMVAYARTIEYSVAKDAITLSSMASLEQDGAIISGERIQYDIKRDVVTAKGSNTGNRRIQVVIPPEALESE